MIMLFHIIYESQFTIRYRNMCFGICFHNHFKNAKVYIALISVKNNYNYFGQISRPAYIPFYVEIVLILIKRKMFDPLWTANKWFLE